MLILGSPFKLPASVADMPDLSERFWYWQGASGRKYIHSVYGLESCPPLPGAIYVGVKRQGTMRIAVSVGRFLPIWQSHLGVDEMIGDVDEVHVHLLAKNTPESDQVLSDLRLALGDDEEFSSADGLPKIVPPSHAWQQVYA